MQEEWYKPSRRDILRTNAYRSTPYGKECSERNLDEAHTVLERRIQRGDACRKELPRVREEQFAALYQCGKSSTDLLKVILTELRLPTL